MATYTQLSYGSSGNDVKKLQQALIKAGYSVGSAGADGIYGSATQKAVRAYQKANGLSVDGIAGKITLGSLYGASTSNNKNNKNNNNNNNKNNKNNKTNNNKTATFTYEDFKVSKETTNANKARQEAVANKPADFTYEDYEKSDIVKQAEAILQEHTANKPGEYQSNWQTQLNETLNAILNREKFSYDLNGDALYQQYKDTHNLQGLKGMMNAMGQAQAMTGGYGNSYAQSVGQQTYQDYMQQLNDRIPELYQLALDQYNREGQELYNQYGLYVDRDNQDYSRYRDTLSDYYTDLNYLTDEARYQAEQDYGKWMDNYNIEYGQYRDEVGDYQWDVNRADNEYWNLYNRDYTQYTDDKTFDYSQFVNDRDFNYTSEQTAKSDAKETVMSMISLGVMPSDAQLKAAGISKADAKKMVSKVNEEAKKTSSTSGSSSSGSGGKYTSSKGTTYNTHGYSTEQIKNLQRAAGITADGIWGANTEKAYQNGVRPEDYKGDKGNSGGGANFSGSTYEEAVAFMKSNGVSSSMASGVMTRSEWSRRKASYNASGIGSSEVTENNSYQEYLKSYVKYALDPDK